MKRVIVTTDNMATSCKSCGRILTNPGYHKQSRFCCRKYRRWYTTTEITYEYDDGRDEHGRFHHAADKHYTVIKREILIEGGN